MFEFFQVFSCRGYEIKPGRLSFNESCNGPGKQFQLLCSENSQNFYSKSVVQNAKYFMQLVTIA